MDKVGLGKWKKNYVPPSRWKPQKKTETKKPGKGGKDGKPSLGDKIGDMNPFKRKKKQMEPQHYVDYGMLAARPVTETIDAALWPVNKVAGTDISVNKYNPASEFSVTKNMTVAKWGAYGSGWAAITGAAAYLTYGWWANLIWPGSVKSGADAIVDEAQKNLKALDEQSNGAIQGLANNQEAKRKAREGVRLAQEVKRLATELKALEDAGQDSAAIERKRKEHYAKLAEYKKNSGDWSARIYAWVERGLIGGAIVGILAAGCFCLGGRKYFPREMSVGAFMTAGSACFSTAFSFLGSCFGKAKDLAFGGTKGRVLPAP